jgi:GDP/UDP-N,N'-diacetylbacillosamine 2-epimerase (hydrolysing)
LKALLDESHHVYTVGALSLDNLKEITIPDRTEFLKRYDMKDERFCLVTFHPETVGWEKNEAYTRELCAAMAVLEEYKVVTMPNADTAGNTVRKILIEFAEGRTDIRLIESLGTIGYFAFIQHSEFLLGNSSSGIIEAGSFGKYVINTGDRQKGRVFGPNVMQCEIKKEKIVEAVNRIRLLPPALPHTIYGDGCTAMRIVNHLKEIYRSIQ